MDNQIIALVGSVAGTMAFLGGIVLALTQLIKKTLVTNTRYAPWISMVLGVVAAYFFIGELPVSLRLLVGVMIGLTASGFYSAAKTTIQG